MPFIRITPDADKAAGRGRPSQATRPGHAGAPAVLKKSLEAWRKAAKKDIDKWVPVRSSWVAAVRYNRVRGTMDLRVKKGGKEYPDFPDMDYQKFYNLLRIRSVGKWMWRVYWEDRRAGSHRKRKGKGRKQ